MSHYRTGVIPPIPETGGVLSEVPLSVQAGKNAYQLAKSLGFRGLLVNWNRHIRGLKGEQGDIGLKGYKGDAGYSPYDIEVTSSKFKGTLDEWLYQHSSKFFIDKTLYLTKSFNTYWDTRKLNTNSTDFRTIKLPLIKEGNYDFIVDWGDGESSHVTYWRQNTHQYPRPDIYKVTIYGQVDGWCFNQNKDAEKLLCIEQWGQLKLGNRGGYFKDCINLEVIAEDVLNLETTHNLTQAFKGCTNLKSLPKLETWNWAEVNILKECFMNCHKFNQNLNFIDSSKLINIDKAFYNCNSLNQPFYYWEVENLLSAKEFMVNTNLSIENYAQTLFSWAEQLNLKRNVQISFNPTLANNIAQAAKLFLLTHFNWSITDGGLV